MCCNGLLVCALKLLFGCFLDCAESILWFQVWHEGHEALEERCVARYARCFVGERVGGGWIASKFSETLAFAEEEAGVLRLVERTEDGELWGVPVNFIDELF